MIEGEYHSFTYLATLVEEVPISIGYADEWKVHEVGSKATVTLDHSGFFADRSNPADMAEKKDSLRISFDSEDTQRGDAYVESNGWVVVTRSLETEFYGVDAFYFNFYYSGNDATAFFRVIDEDNEYWYAPIKLASNARQTIIIKLEEFTLRTKGTPVMNEKFDYQYLKSMELVFERVDGDGIAYFGNLRAIKYQNYSDMFIEKVNYSLFASSITSESAYFDFTNTVSESGDALTYSFTTRDGVPEAQRGYGFVKMNVGKILATGYAFSFHVDLSGIATDNFNFLVRVIEEDNDLWIFKIYAKDIPADGNLLVPFSAFLLAEGGFKGDGIRQFYYIKQLQFGLSGCYQAGAITVDGFEIVSLADKVEDLYKTTVAENGLIEGFESYQNGIDAYYKWQTSTANKDEAIGLYTETALGANNQAAKFYYKTDLPDAEYRINFTSVSGYTAIEITAKDVPEGSARATMTIYLHGGPSELYYYEIKRVDKSWMKYTIPINDFKLTEESFGSQHISCESITGITIAATSGFIVPQYNSGSYLCVDNIRFSDATEYSKKEVSGKIKPSEENEDIAMISDFDSDETFVYWSINTSADYIASNSELSYSSDVTAKEGRSLKMTYKAKMVAPYYADIIVDNSVDAKGLTLLLKGDNKSANAEIIIAADGKNYVYTIIGIAEGWNTYSIGFANFKEKGNESVSFNKNNVSHVTRVSIYIKNPNDPGNSYFTGSIYMDEIYFDDSISTSTNSVTAYVA